MTRILAIIAALALGVVAFSNVFSFALSGTSSAYECRFGFSPNDDDGFDRAWGHTEMSILKAVKQQRGKWYSVEVKLTPEG